MHKSGWVVYKFDKEEDREKVLQGRSYFVFGIPMFLKIMPKCFLFDEDGRFVPAWIQIHGLPPDCWTQRVLSMIRSEVGKPLYTDNLTRTRERLDYARLMVEVPAFGERIHGVPITLPTGVQVDLKIIYEMVPDYCQRCKKMGHRTDTCRGRNGAAGQQNDGSEPGAQAEPNANENRRHRSQSFGGRGRTRMRYRRRTSQQWRPKQQVNTPNGGQPAVQNDLAIIAVDSPVPIDIEPPIVGDTERQEPHQMPQDQGHQEGQQDDGNSGNAGGQQAGRTAHQPPGFDHSRVSSTSPPDTAERGTILMAAEASTSPLPSGTSAKAREEVGANVPAPTNGRRLRARAAQGGGQ